MIQTTRHQGGFTIVEFMVATTVFSLVLLATTAAIIAISRTYQRSINDSQTQAVARNLVDTIAQSVQFSGSAPVYPGVPASGVSSVCFGNRQFIYVLGKQLGTGPGDTRGGFLSRQSDTCTIPENVTNTVIAGSNATSELLSENMRLSNLAITDLTGGLYQITARVVYGDDDVLCLESASPCLESTVLNAVQASSPSVQCKPGIGSRFCSVSELSLTVQRRIQ